MHGVIQDFIVFWFGPDCPELITLADVLPGLLQVGITLAIIGAVISFVRGLSRGQWRF